MIFPVLYSVCVHVRACAHVCTQSLSHVWLCNPMDCSPPALLVHYSLTYLLTYFFTCWLGGSTVQAVVLAWGAASPVHKVSWLSRVLASVNQLLGPPLISPRALVHHLQGSVLAYSNHSTPGFREPGQMAPTCRDSWSLCLTNSSILSTRSRHFPPHLLHVTSDFSLS